MNYCARGHFIPDSQFGCATCAEESSKRELASQQPQYLRRAATSPDYWLRVMKNGGRHVLMYSTYPQPITFCGQAIKEAKPPVTREPLSEDTFKKICPLCRSALRDALAEVCE